MNGKTFSAKPHEVRHDWYLVDANQKILGRLAAQIALRLRGKHKPEYTPHVDTGDYIVVVNAAKLRVTGAKPTGKVYYPPFELPGRCLRDDVREDAAALSRARAAKGGQGDAAQGSASATR